MKGHVAGVGQQFEGASGDIILASDGKTLEPLRHLCIPTNLSQVFWHFRAKSRLSTAYISTSWTTATNNVNIGSIISLLGRCHGRLTH
jgi:hypothetical protein